MFRRRPPSGPAPDPIAQTFPSEAPTPREPAPAREPLPPREPQPVAPPAPPEFLRDTELRTSLAADSVVTGKLSFTTPTRIDGKLKGELRCTQLLVVGSTAIVEGWIRADNLRIEGTVRGEIADTRRVEIRPGGKFLGRVTAEMIVLHEGGLLDGECRIGAAAEERVERGVRAR